MSIEQQVGKLAEAEVAPAKYEELRALQARRIGELLDKLDRRKAKIRRLKEKLAKAESSDLYFFESGRRIERAKVLSYLESAGLDEAVVDAIRAGLHRGRG